MTITVQFDKDKYHLQSEMTKWCEEFLGKNADGRNWIIGNYEDENEWHTRTWALSSMFGNTFFYFKNESDATAFTLKWQ